MRRGPLLAMLLLVACASLGRPADPAPESATEDDAVTVGSFDFTESAIVAELYAQALERGGVRVVRQLRLGPREVVAPALQRGLVELVPEYSGSLYGFLTGSPSPTDDLQARSAMATALASRGLAQLAWSPAEDANAFAVTAVFAAEHDLETLSDLAEVSGLTLGGPAECEERPLCRPGLEETYRITFDAFVPLDLSGPLTADALSQGVVDVALVFTTSPILDGPAFVVLQDDRALQPSEHVTPIVHASVLDRFGREVADPVNDVSSLLTTLELRGLNADVERGEGSVRAVAAAWLDAHGFAPEPGAGAG
jgi:osmoprotectant transport system substrate-binding protein